MNYYSIPYSYICDLPKGEVELHEQQECINTHENNGGN
jgi:hypothetical protein